MCSIGFNNDVALGARTLHVQTEVVGMREYTIRTMVLEGGVVRLTHKSGLADVGGLEQAEAVVRAQHQQVVERVKRGDI